MQHYLRRLTQRGRISLGLERPRIVAKRMGIQLQHSTIVTFAGTNGKGSSCAFAEQIALLHGLSTGLYTSPHLLCFNERIRINGNNAGDEELLTGLAAVDACSDDDELSYFEFTTLAALFIFAQRRPDVLILEVGLGGRLDAVNVVAPACAVVTSVSYDHQHYLGDSLEQILTEKLGIAQAGRPMIIGPGIDYDVTGLCSCSCIPAYLREHHDGYRIMPHYVPTVKRFHPRQEWSCQVHHRTYRRLASPRLQGKWQYGNAACAISALADSFHLEEEKISKAIARTSITGRLQWVTINQQPVLVDIAHNVESAAALADYLSGDYEGKKILAIFSTLADKDSGEIIQRVKDIVTHWFIYPLKNTGTCRDTDLTIMRRAFSQVRIDRFRLTEAVDFDSAFRAALEHTGGNTMILAFGSFFVVQSALQMAQFRE